MFKKLLFASAFFLGTALTVNSQIVINEIMYNEPGVDQAEFVELVNTTASPFSLNGYSLSDNSTSVTFSNKVIPANGYFVVTLDSAAYRNSYGFNADTVWTASLVNSSEAIVLKNPNNVTIDSVTYDDGAPWPTEGDGLGQSIQLCDATTDNLVGANWGISFAVSGTTAAGSSLYSTPGAANACSTPPAKVYTSVTIADVNGEDGVTGIADSLGGSYALSGIVQCIDFDGNAGYSFFLSNSNGEGINVFSFTDVGTYTMPTAGDSILVKGDLGQFNGLTQIVPDSITVETTGNATLSPVVVTALSEATESKYVTLENVHIVDTSAWTNSGSGFNVLVTDGGSDTALVRIDADGNIYGTPVPAGTFNVSGFGGQFDNSNPFDDGYQLLPCSLNDIVPVTTSINTVNELVVGVYPNPANRVVTVSSTTSLGSVIVLNTVGQVVYNNTTTNNIMRLDVSSFVNGNYIIRVANANGSTTKQLVVIK